MRLTRTLRHNRRLRAAAIVLGVLALGWLMVRSGFDKDIVAAVLVVVGAATKILGLLSTLLAAIPFIGPFLAQILTLPFVLVVNALAYVVSFFALRRGETADAMRAKVIAWGVLIGFVLGFLLGRALPHGGGSG